MSGGPASLRTAAMTLGLALGILGVAAALRGMLASQGKPGEAMSLMAYASMIRPTKPTASPVALETVETDPPQQTTPVRRVSSSPATLLAQIDPEDFPPPPAKATERDDFDPADALFPRRAPTAELIDAEPMPEPFAPPTPAIAPAPAAVVADCCKSQEQQLARIAFGIELLARQATQTMIERATAEPAPVRPEVFSPLNDRESTAMIKIERTAADRDRFSLEVKSAPVRDVFGMLCDLAGLKLEFSPEVTERTTITLRDITLGEAINAVLQHTKLGVEREEHLLRVMPRGMAEDRAMRRQPQITKIYRPQVIRMADLLPLIRPVMTPRTGRLAVMPDPAGRLCPDLANTFPSLPSEILVIVDRAEVHTEVAELLKELDVKMTTP